MLLIWAIMNPAAIFIAVLKLKKVTKDLLRTGCCRFIFIPWYVAFVCMQTLSKRFFGEWIED